MSCPRTAASTAWWPDSSLTHSEPTRMRRDSSAPHSGAINAPFLAKSHRAQNLILYGEEDAQDHFFRS